MSLNSDPQISVVLPVFNGAKYLRQSIDSVLSQSLNDFELIIRDDGSNDNSPQIIQSYDDSRIRVIESTGNLGIFGSINLLIGHCKSPFIHLWAQDDIMNPDCLETCLAFHQQHSNIAFSFSFSSSINDKGEVIREGSNNGKRIVVGPEDSIPVFIIYGCIPGNISTVTLNKSVILKEGLFNSELSFVGDFDMWVRLSSKYLIGKIQEPLVQIRIHKEQASQQDEMLLKKMQETISLYQRQLSLLNNHQKKVGYRIIKWKHQSHFVFVLLSIFRNGKLKLAIRYIRELGKMDIYFLLLSRALWLHILRMLKRDTRFKIKLYKPFQCHIDNFH
jgi:glycosyltransferase involved in cell wall biosynthesis